TEYKICNNSKNYLINDNYCKSICNEECHQIYYSLDFENKQYFGLNDSKIKIIYNNLEEFHYKSEPKYSFVNYLSNIGGLVGLWFGFAFIDTSALITLFISYTKLFLNKYIVFKIYFFKLKLVILKLEKY